MAVTIEDLYRSYGVLADAKDNLSQVSKWTCVRVEQRAVLLCRSALFYFHCF